MIRNSSAEGHKDGQDLGDAIDDKMLQLQLKYLNRPEADYTAEAWFAYLRGAQSMVPQSGQPITRIAIEFLLCFASEGEPAPYPKEDDDVVVTNQACDCSSADPRHDCLGYDHGLS